MHLPTSEQVFGAIDEDFVFRTWLFAYFNFKAINFIFQLLFLFLTIFIFLYSLLHSKEKIIS